jgi:1-acyl-sn-glycerol-3-phosphate acyltransferase
MGSEVQALEATIPAHREVLIEQAVGFLANRDPGYVAGVRQRLERELDLVGEGELGSLLERMVTTGGHWGYHPPHPTARHFNHLLGTFVIEQGSRLEQAEHLAAAERGSVTFLVNHLSFADANVFEWLLHAGGFNGVVERLTVLAGPKVYTDPFRRFSSMCFGSIKTPQSQSLASGEAVMSRREVAKLAAETIAAVEARRKAGDHLLVFVEGTRSRSGGMQPALAAASRYLDDPDVVILPVGIRGSERLVPVGEERVHETTVIARVGAPVKSGELFSRCEKKRGLAMDVVGLLIARQLPPEYRGAYADDAPNLETARGIAAEF